MSVCLLAEVACALGDDGRAATLYGRLLPYEDRVAISCQELSLGAVARYLGLLAATLGRDADAELHFVQALELNARLGARPWLAQTRRRTTGCCCAPAVSRRMSRGRSSCSPTRGRRTRSSGCRPAERRRRR